jgi:hypothetical protein
MLPHYLNEKKHQWDNEKLNTYKQTPAKTLTVFSYSITQNEAIQAQP